MDKNQKAFFELLRAGLWENCREFQVSSLWFQDSIDWEKVYQLAEEQSVIGVVLAGIEHSYVKPPQELLLQWIGEVQMLEQQNLAMNKFVAQIVEKLRGEDVYTLLVKGQGIAQCYEKPLWRSCGDVDFFLSEDNCEKAISFLSPLSESVEEANHYEKHLAMTIDSWVVELHGNLRCGLSRKIDRELDTIKKETFYEGDVRSWVDGRTHVFMLSEKNDAVYVFTHILNHFYKGGVGLRQICDWCRLLWTYRDKIDAAFLERRLWKMGLVSEWKAFGTFAVEYLGMPSEAMPLYSASEKWTKKSDKICEFVMEVGNFGHNRDTSYYGRYPFIVRKAISLGNRCADLYRHAKIFPLDSFKFFPFMMINGFREALRR